MKPNELLPCPFCGGVPKTSHRPESEAAGGGHVAFVVCYCGGYASTAHQMGHAETVQAAIAEVVEKWNTRAQQSSKKGEAVNVVGIRISTDGFGSYIADSTMGIGPAFPGEVREQLMTVAQHNRIMAAATPADSRVVLVELLERIAKPFEPGVSSGDHVVAVRELRALLEVKP